MPIDRPPATPQTVAPRPADEAMATPPSCWVFSATQPFQGIRVNNATITDPTYAGIMVQTDYSVR
ncbi:hypothetical protein GCM10010170_031390 [Dactylosporangium salmoneum]|uniref:Uncharacterized protein n=1 Tax=Dactylosporangium salmoneum TaxID=53361 RepID=A0ABP5T4D9_9ACTN